MDRKLIILALRDKRYTYKKIGEFLGISRQRVSQIETSSPISPENHKILTKKKRAYLGIKDKGMERNEGTDFPRELIRIRDNHTCQICGKIWEKGQRKLDIHHIDFAKEKTRQYDNFLKEKDNMITLCHKCHLNLEEHRLAMSNGQAMKK